MNSEYPKPDFSTKELATGELFETISFIQINFGSPRIIDELISLKSYKASVSVSESAAFERSVLEVLLNGLGQFR